MSRERESREGVRRERERERERESGGVRVEKNRVERESSEGV